MEWNWQLINSFEGQTAGRKYNLPEFKKPVLLGQKNGDTILVTVGFLIFIDAEGPHWTFNMNNIYSSFMDGNLYSSCEKEKKAFVPTHWVEIQLPKE